MTEDERMRLGQDAGRLWCRIMERLLDADAAGDDERMRWLWKRIVSLERDAQKREAGVTPETPAT